MSELVLTPGGYRHRSLVHPIGPEHALHAAEGRLRIMDVKRNAVVEAIEAAAPWGELPALGSGWIAYTYWNNGTGKSLSSFRTTWQVPSAPATVSNQTVFLFNGIQNYGANFGILQPVLQWGPSAAGGGPQWSVASWYVTSGGDAFHSQLVPVQPGATLIGVMTLTGSSDNKFSYISEFEGIAGTLLPVQNIAELLWCNETLEAYEINQCSDYPAAPRTVFRDISIQSQGTPLPLNWTPLNKVTDCGQHAVVVSNSAASGEVDIFYSNR